ncbi:MAG: hypothetical protein OXU77_19335 [Gammaproteobacteria bacterium]|nr:hypothetical protein [Gammaproteobacteria bacterium]MDE0444321.1 hypothetical protein [Gammaproteobacteria bacterium]
MNLIPFLLAAAATVAEEGERTCGVILFVGDGMGVNPILGYAAGADGVGGVMDQHELHAVMRAALFGKP